MTLAQGGEVTDLELRDPEEARCFVLQGLWWQRVLPPSAATIRPALEWALEIASAGDPLPPVGFLADLGHVAFGEEWEQQSNREPVSIPHLPINIIRTYEDHVLGKFYADWSFARACDALRHYEGRDRARGLAFVCNRFRERSHFPGVILAPGVIKAALEAPPEEVLSEGFESLRQEGSMDGLVDLYQGLIQAARHTAEVLNGTEDVEMLEQGTALAPPAEQLALRQVLRAATLLEASLPRHRVKPINQRMEVPTRILDEDTYPVGGFTSISNRGSIESLLYSQLAYMESEEAERPDLFDIKFLRDELLYYSRDENQFLRRRRSFVFVLHPDLISTRFKDADLPYQRGVLLLGLIRVVVQKLSEWLSSDALSFRLLFVGPDDPMPLQKEHDLMATILSVAIANKTGELVSVSAEEVPRLCEEWSRRSLVRCVVVGTHPAPIEARDTLVTRLGINGPRVALADEDEKLEILETDDPLQSWSKALEMILERWV
jgi:hypothetical protein